MENPPDNLQDMEEPSLQEFQKSIPKPKKNIPIPIKRSKELTEDMIQRIREKCVRKFKYDVYGTSHDSVLNRCNDRFAKAIGKIGMDVRQRSLEELIEIIKPSVVLGRVRMSFWTTFKITLEQGWTEFPEENVYGWITTPDMWMRILHDPEELAFVLTPPLAAGVEFFDEIEELALIEMRNILLSPKSSDTTKLRVFQLLGMARQAEEMKKIAAEEREQKRLFAEISENPTSARKKTYDSAEGPNMGQLDAEIRQLQGF